MARRLSRELSGNGDKDAVSSMMAGSRVVGSTRRLCHRYQLFFFIAFFLLFMQLFLAYNFYTVNQAGVGKMLDWEQRVAVIEREHQKHWPKEDDDNDSEVNKSMKEAQKQNGQGAAEGPNNVKRLPDIDRQVAGQHPSPSMHGGRRHRKTHRGTHNVQRHAPANVSTAQAQYNPRCEISSKDALSAILRARSVSCKQELADVACLEQAGKLYTTKLPRYCPLKEDTMGEYLGCFRDSARNRLLGGYKMEFREENTPRHCLYFCLRAGFQYAGTQFSYECWCGDNLTRDKKTLDARCDSACPGNNTETCGGYLTLAVYKTGYGAKPYGNAAYVRPQDLLPSEKKARIVFVLTVNGRALRQVKRLFKILYHTQHYYYLHVDSRQEYLYRELSALAARFPNVRMAPRRMSTIWGGASLLTMLLHCMQDLMAIREWHWDFFINLSESDYPVKPLNDLTAFLTRYKGKNFVRSHGRDTPRFIRKQGLDKTFYECDTHMWRLGTRPLLEGVRMDGGSDWIGLSHDFCRYIVSSHDELIRGLYTYYKYTLLPAESFFHTLLQNSEFCTTMVNNNLHLTNWRRKQGCKCQYKHIVDWCGCSPNDFLPSDLDKLLGNEDRPVYFARKFEAIVNQEVINELDAYLYGNYPDDTSGLTSYWQSDFHHQDVATPTDDAQLTFYKIFSTLGTVQVKSQLGCSFTPNKIKEATLFSYSDQLQGLLVRYTVQSGTHDGAEKGLERELETYVQPQKKYKLIQPVGPVSRIKNLEVGSSFDPKEELFRNFAGLMGPYSEISLTHAWGSGQQFTATVVFVDPAHTVAGSYDIPVKGEEVTGNLKPTFSKPLRPGVWTVKLLYMWEVAVETQFLISPLLVYGGREIRDAEASILHQGPKGRLYSERDLSDMKSFLQLQDSQSAEKLAVENGNKKGKALVAWAQSLALQMWHLSDTCVSGDVLQDCPRLTSCQQTSWSSLSPDPKSVVGPVKENGRIR